jgi:multiple sugar transport system ATP-binding protein
VRLSDGTLLPMPPVGPPGAGRRVVAAIRPEAYRRDPAGSVALGVALVEPTGPELHVFGTIAGTEVRVVLRDRDIPAPGEVLRLSVAPDAVALFDPDTGRRL